MAPIKSDQFEYAFRPQSIEVLRKQLGLTQAGLAEELDVPVNTVSRWETGATTPDAPGLGRTLLNRQRPRYISEFLPKED